MGKNLIQQARGKGSPTYRAPSFKYMGPARNKALTAKSINGEVVDIVKCRGHSSPLIKVTYEDGDVCLMVAPEGVKIGDRLTIGNKVEIRAGNIAPLNDLPDGTLVYNIESNPGDGGKFCRSSGTFAKVLSHTKEKVLVQLPSKKQKMFMNGCRATIGTVAGSGRVEKPFLRAGTKYYYMRARNKLWPKVSGNAQNAVDHPFGTSRSQRKSKVRPTPRNAPPGRKVGMISPTRSGRKKR